MVRVHCLTRVWIWLAVCRESTTQTAVDTGTNPIHRKNYIAGLRGAPQTKMKVVQLQLEL